MNMSAGPHQFYRHSGKFGVHGPLLAVLAACLLGYPLGIAYAYLIEWIPFVYLNFFITLFYGMAFGLLSAFLLRSARVRNTFVATLTGLAAGLCAYYFSWNGYVHTLVTDPPRLADFGQLSRLNSTLYTVGSWGIGSSGTPVTGILLGLVWAVEAAMIIGACTQLASGAVAQIPYCESCRNWLSEEENIDTLDHFASPEHIQQFKAGSIAPLDQARPRDPAAGRFARLTLRHSPKCAELCTLSVDNVSVSVDKEGKSREKSETIISNLQVPKSLLERLSKAEPAAPQGAPAAG
jgi:hypothetical protein